MEIILPNIIWNIQHQQPEYHHHSFKKKNPDWKQHLYICLHAALDTVEITFEYTLERRLKCSTFFMRLISVEKPF